MFDFPLTSYDIKVMIIMSSLSLFVIGFISFLIYQENRLKDLEDKAPEDHEILGMKRYSTPKR